MTNTTPVPLSAPGPEIVLPSGLPDDLADVYAEYRHHIDEAQRLDDERYQLRTDVGGRPVDYDVARAGEALRNGEPAPKPVATTLAELDAAIATHDAAADQARAEVLTAARAVADDQAAAAAAALAAAHARWVRTVDQLADAHREMASAYAVVRIWTSYVTNDQRHNYNIEDAPLTLRGVGTYGGATRAREMFDDLRHALDWVAGDVRIDPETGAST